MRNPTRDELLAQFPGPVVLSVSRVRYGLTFAIFFLVACFALYVTIFPVDHPWKPAAPWKGWAVILLFGSAAVVTAGNLIPGFCLLVLTREGFVATSFSFFGKVEARWSEVGGFVVKTPLWRVSSFQPPQVMFNRSTRPPAGPLFSYNSAMGPNFGGLSANDLADLMNAWRERALAETSSHLPSPVWGEKVSS